MPPAFTPLSWKASTAFREPASKQKCRFDFSSAGKTLLCCTYGSSRPGADFPLLARLHLAGRLPIDRMITGHTGLDGVNDAFERMRRGDGARTVIVY